MNIRYFILGFLNQKPMSGYGIKRFLDRFSWLIVCPGFGSLYPALHALLKDDLVTVEIIPHESKPPRKIYSITEMGRAVLQEWFDQRAISDTPLKAFVMGLILADSLAPAELAAYLQHRRTQVADQHATLEQVIRVSLDEERGLRRQLALDYGLAIATAELDWLDGKLERLLQQSLPMEVVSGDGALVRS